MSSCSSSAHTGYTFLPLLTLIFGLHIVLSLSTNCMGRISQFLLIPDFFRSPSVSALHNLVWNLSPVPTIYSPSLCALNRFQRLFYNLSYVIVALSFPILYVLVHPTASFLTRIFTKYQVFEFLTRSRKCFLRTHDVSRSLVCLY